MAKPTPPKTPPTNPPKPPKTNIIIKEGNKKDSGTESSYENVKAEVARSKSNKTPVDPKIKQLFNPTPQVSVRQDIKPVTPVSSAVKNIFTGRVNAMTSGGVAAKLAREGPSPQSIRDDDQVTYNVSAPRGQRQNYNLQSPGRSLEQKQAEDRRIKKAVKDSEAVEVVFGPQNRKSDFDKKALELEEQEKQYYNQPVFKKIAEKTKLNIGNSSVAQATQGIVTGTFQAPLNVLGFGLYGSQKIIGLTEGLFNKPKATLKQIFIEAPKKVEQNEFSFLPDATILNPIGIPNGTPINAAGVATVFSALTMGFVSRKPFVKSSVEFPQLVEAESGISNRVSFGQNIAVPSSQGGFNVFSDLEIGKSKALYKLGGDLFEVSGQSKTKGVMIDESNQLTQGVSDFQVSQIRYGLFGGKKVLKTTPASASFDSLITKGSVESESNILSLSRIEVPGKTDIFKATTAKATEAGDVITQRGASFITNSDLSKVTPEVGFAAKSTKVVEVAEDSFIRSVSEDKFLGLGAKDFGKELKIKPSSEQFASLKRFKSEVESGGAGYSSKLLNIKSNPLFPDLNTQGATIVSQIAQPKKVPTPTSFSDVVVKQSIRLAGPPRGDNVLNLNNLRTPSQGSQSFEPFQTQGLNFGESSGGLSGLRFVNLGRASSKSSFDSIGKIGSRGSQNLISGQRSSLSLGLTSRQDLSQRGKLRQEQNILSEQIVGPQSVSLLDTLQKQSVIPRLLQLTEQKQSLNLKSLFSQSQTPAPKKALIPPLSFDLKKRGGDLFGVEIKRYGLFKSVASNVPFKSAINILKQTAGSTAARSGRVLFRGKPVDVGFLPGFYKKGNIQIESSQFAINTPGELGEITFKGVQASKNRKSSRFII